MKCTRQQLLDVERLRAPGYVAAVIAAAVADDGRVLEVPDAEWRRLRREFGGDACPGPRPVRILPRLNVGTWIESAARLVGITSERIERITRRPCGCRGRRDWINAACHRLAERGDAVLLRAWRSVHALFGR